MKLVDLKQYIENNADKSIITSMVKDSEDTLNTFISSVICDLLQTIPMDENLKVNAKNNINNFDEKSIGELSTYISLIPYVQLKLKDVTDGYVIATGYIEMLISYMVGYIYKEEFMKNLYNIKQTLEISDKLYNGIVTYFSINNQKIVNKINEKLK